VTAITPPRDWCPTCGYAWLLLGHDDRCGTTPTRPTTRETR